MLKGGHVAALAAGLLTMGAAADCGKEALDTDCVVDSDLLYLPGIVSAGDCCQMCGETKHCQAFTYRGESHECWLKQDCHKTKHSPGLTSGQLKSQCAAEVLQDMDCKVDQDLDYFFGIASTGDCCDLCRQAKHCGAYTHREESQECWLKPDCSEQVTGTGLVSAILRTTTTTTAKLQCAAEVLHGMDCQADQDLDYLPGVANSGDCCDLCRQSKHCGAYTYRKRSQECWLKRDCSEQVKGTGLVSAILRTTTKTSTATTSTTTSPPASDSMTIRALHHNPHWECTADEACRGQEYALFESLLVRHRVDFASLIMGGDYLGSPDARWQVTTSQSNLDKAAIVWDDAQWELLEALETQFVEDRAAMLGRFRRRSDHSVSLVVASLHFPHDAPWAFDDLLREMGERLWALAGEQTDRFLIMADTNLNHEELWSPDLGAKLLLSGDVRSTDPLPTCCADGSFGLTYDRIFSNFGESFQTLVDEEYRELSSDFTAAPFWAAAVKKPGQECTAAFHHPVLAQLDLEPAVPSLWV